MKLPCGEGRVGCDLAGKRDSPSYSPHRISACTITGCAARGQGFVEDRFQQAAAFGLGRGELRFQPVADGHQLVHLRHDAALLGEGRKGISIRRRRLNFA